MPILYALIARQKSVLAEYTSSSGNFPTVTRVLLAKIPPDNDSKMSYVYDHYVFHYVVDQGITFLCMTDESAKRRITFAFLDDIKATWRDKYNTTEQTALAFSMNEAFAPVLKQKIVMHLVSSSLNLAT
jgi:vesicle-associated membrane protein 7